jgi:hypothetical protein
MLKRYAENSDNRAQVVPPAVQHAKTVLAFVYDKVVRQNRARLMYVASLGALSRFLNLLAFVGALKGVLVAIKSDAYAAFLQRVLTRQGFDVSVSGSDVVLIVIATLIAINICASLANHFRFLGVSELQEQFLATAVRDAGEVKLNSDRFLIDRVAPAIDVLAKLAEILLFSLMIFVTIAFINLNIVLFLFPLVLMIPLPGLMARRHRLRVIEKKRRALEEYKNAFPEEAADEERLSKWIEVERNDFISASRALRKNQLQSRQISNFVLALGFIALIAYMPFIEFNSVQLLSIPLPLIFIVLALRQVMAQANEFGRDLSTLLELRNGIKVLTAADEADDNEKPKSGNLASI